MALITLVNLIALTMLITLTALITLKNNIKQNLKSLIAANKPLIALITLAFLIS
jgi:hypothetical protein